ncbi:MAG: PHP domain-containing protein, partial [Myxococcota bacterium]
RDSWIVIIAMGLERRNLMGPLLLDVPFGEIQLSRVAADAFSRVPVVNTLFTATPVAPDWNPIAPYAVTNPIYLDTGGDGRYDAPLPRPQFCSRPCTVDDPNSPCPDGQVCLSREEVCGFEIAGQCTRRVAPGIGSGH